MPVVDVVNLDGKKVGQLELADAVFGAKVNPHLLHEASRWYLRGLRAGTHKTKDKSEVQRRGPQALETKGYRPSARRVDSFAALAPWTERCTGRSHGITVMPCRRRCCWARCDRRYPRSWRNRN